MTQILRESTAVDVLIGPFVDSTDGYTAVESGISPDVQLSKNGQALVQRASPFNTPTHDANGYYNCELGTNDTDTIGTLILTVVGSATSLPIRHEFQVLDQLTYDAIYSSTPTMLTSGDIGLLYESTISSPVSSQTQFVMNTAFPESSWVGLTCSVEDISTGHKETRWISSSDQATETLTISSTVDFTVEVGDILRVYSIEHPTYALNSFDPSKVADITSLQTNLYDRMLAYTQLMTRSDSAIKTDRSVELGLINTNEGSGAGTYDSLFDSQEQAGEHLTAIAADTNELQTDWVNGGRLDTILDAAATSAEITALNDITAADVWAEVLGTTTLSASALVQIIAGVVAGEVAGGGTTTITIRNVQDSATLITATVDASGNRTAVSISTPAD